MAKKKVTKPKKLVWSAAGTKAKKIVYDSEGTAYTVTNIKPKVGFKRSEVRPPSVKKSEAPLPTSCHYSRNAAKVAAEKLRVKKVKARVVTSGKYFCVYTVGKCKKGTSI